MDRVLQDTITSKVDMESGVQVELAIVVQLANSWKIQLSSSDMIQKQKVPGEIPRLDSVSALKLARPAKQLDGSEISRV